MTASIECPFTSPHYVPPQPQLTAEQKQGVDDLIQHFNADGYVLPGIEKGELTNDEKMYLSYETLLRFYIGQTRNGTIGTERGLKETIKRLESTMVWRRAEGLNDAETASKLVGDKRGNCNVIAYGFGTTGMPIIYFFPNRDARPIAERNVVGAFYIMDRAQDLSLNGTNQAIVIFSFTGKREGPTPTPNLTKELISGYATHYPESLGSAIVLDMPWWARIVVNIVWPFVDAHTKEKVVFSGKEAFDKGDVRPSSLLEPCGGELDFPDTDTYWSTFLEKALQRRREFRKVWEDMGPPQVGREERIFKATPGGAA